MKVVQHTPLSESGVDEFAITARFLGVKVRAKNSVAIKNTNQFSNIAPAS